MGTVGHSMLLFACYLILLLFSPASCQLSSIAHDDQVDITKNKFLQRQATADSAIPNPSDEDIIDGQCPQNVQVKWMTEVTSSVYSTPLITDLYSDGRKDIIVPSFVHYLEVLEGADGGKLPDWTAFHKSTVHASPLLYDIDFDGVQDIALATYDGEILFFRDTGEQMAERLTVPRLRVRRDWFKGLAPDHVDHSHPDVGDKKDGQQEPVLQDAPRFDGDLGSVRRRHLLQEGDSAPNAGDGQVQGAEAQGVISEEAADSFGELFGGQERLFGPSKPGVEPGLMGADVAEREHDPWQPEDPPGLHRHRWGGDYEDYGGDFHGEWGDEEFREAPHARETEYVEVDAHIMCTPAIADIDGDGHDELVVAVSYFFDREYYDAEEHRGELPEGVDAADYIASGLVAFGLRSRTLRWQQHLDLSTDRTQFRAYAYSGPTLADLEGDGKLEVVVGTSVGFLYVLDSGGVVREGWPLQMGEVQGQAAVADIDGDGRLEVIAGDTRGNIAAFTADGKEVWERHVASLIAQAATLGDVNGDGRLEVVVGTSSGNIHVLDATSGADVAPFPFRTRGRVMAPVLLTPLGAGPGQHIIVMSFDGLLYMVDGVTGCADTVDIGETSYAMVLAEDLDGNGRTDLLAATMNGNLYCLETPALYHPLKAWPSQVLGPNGFTARYNWAGVYGSAASRAPRDVRGASLPVQFEIVDNRTRAPGQEGNASALGPYTVAVTLQSVGVEQMNAGDQPVIGIMETYAAPGRYTLELPCPRTRSTATIHIQMTDRNGLTFTDAFSLSFHVHFYKLLKWLVAMPMLAMGAAVLSSGGAAAGGRALDGLPSFRSRTARLD